MKWKPDWPAAKENLARWWRREGMALCLIAPRAKPVEKVPKPQAPADLPARWTDPVFRCDRAEHEMANQLFAAEAFPLFDTQIGPGSLGTFLGAEPRFAETTVWYEPCIDDPDAFGGIRFDPAGNRWLDVHMAVIEEGLRRSGGRYLVGMPDLIENIDTLAAMRGNEELLCDLLDRPRWVHERLAEINEAFFAAFELIHGRIAGDDGANAFAAFRVWGPGRTAKVQCDFSCMISPAMFREFVVPYMSAQCGWLDYSMYHLDGEDALQHVDALLGIESLDAIEWTPRGAYCRDLSTGGGSPMWYELYRRIKAGGKAVQAIGAAPEQVVPLLEAVGPEGMFILTTAEDEAAAERVLRRVEPYR